MTNKINTQSLEWKKEYFCGKHKFKTINEYAYHLHVINEHDSEHGFWQDVGQKNWTKDGNIWYGDFRTLRMYCPLSCNCRCRIGYGCWQGQECDEPERHLITTPEAYQKWLDKQWGKYE